MKESGENYLETILILDKKLDGRVRSIDLAKELEFSKPSISRAISILKTNGYLTIDESGYIHLTEAGKNKAEMIYERHQVLTALFRNIAGVSDDIAENDACRVEHVISNETFYGLKAYLEKLQSGQE